VERRQVQDLLPQRLIVQEHQVEQVCCPRLPGPHAGSLPDRGERPSTVWAEGAGAGRVFA
jgi:hypothetical protein